MKRNRIGSAVLIAALLCSVCFNGCGKADEDLPYAYLAVFQAFVTADYSELVKLDLSLTQIEDKEAAYALIESFCAQNNIAMARLEANSPAEGDAGILLGGNWVLLVFADVKCTRTKLITEVSKSWPWAGEGFGSCVTANKRMAGDWEVTSSKTTWRS